MNDRPVSNFSIVAENNSDTFTFMDASTDANGTVDRWSWNISDGFTRVWYGTIQHPGTLTFELPTGVDSRVHTAQLIVYDNHGAYSPYLQKQFTVTRPLPNQAPVADFSHEADLTEVTFTDASTDDRNDIVAWAWDFGDGTISTETDPVHVYPATLADYDVSLEVTDGEGLTDDTTLSVHVDPVPVSVITLRFASAKARKGKMDLRLIWGGAPTTNVEIFREGRLLGTYANDGSEMFSVKRNEKNKTYKVCEVNTDPQRQNACSNTVRISF
jgi:PKD repeat protein